MTNEWVVLGRRNNITQLKHQRCSRLAFTRTAPKVAPAGQVEQFDSRFIAIAHEQAVRTDSYENLKKEFFA